MKRFIEGEDRRQATLLPDSLEDYVTEDNPARVVDVFIDELDLEALGFSGVVPEVTGRPAYHPATRRTPHKVLRSSGPALLAHDLTTFLHRLACLGGASAET
jgi:hypothetical protein